MDAVIAGVQVNKQGELFYDSYFIRVSLSLHAVQEQSYKNSSKIQYKRSSNHIAKGAPHLLMR